MLELYCNCPYLKESLADAVKVLLMFNCPYLKETSNFIFYISCYCQEIIKERKGKVPFCGSEHLHFLIYFILKYSICFCCRRQKRVPSLSALWEQLYDPFRMTKWNKVSVWWKVSPGNFLIQVHKSIRVEDSFFFHVSDMCWL